MASFAERSFDDSDEHEKDAASRSSLDEPYLNKRRQKQAEKQAEKQTDKQTDKGLHMNDRSA